MGGPGDKVTTNLAFLTAFEESVCAHCSGITLSLPSDEQQANKAEFKNVWKQRDLLGEHINGYDQSVLWQSITFIELVVHVLWLDRSFIIYDLCDEREATQGRTNRKQTGRLKYNSRCPGARIGC